MADMSLENRSSVTGLILVPALITLAITILRLVGELQHWPSPLFSNQGGGGGAIVGISWLPIIFGPYFAAKLMRSGDRPSSLWKTIVFALVGFVLMVGGAFLAFAMSKGSLIMVLGGLIIIAAGAAIQFPGWPGLAKTLLAYGYSSRIPVAIIMFFAMQGNWGTHYDAVPPQVASMSMISKWALFGLAPQLVMWILYTMSVGALFGGITAAVLKGRQASPQTSS
jgi:hypothetical protein